MLPIRRIALRAPRIVSSKPIVSALLPSRSYASAPSPTPSPPSTPEIPRVLTGNPEIDDPGMNDGYSLTQPLPIKRQFRNPYEKWWDPQERRNFGEPVHEDEDQLGILTPYEYTAATPRKAFFLVGCAISALFGIAFTVSQIYPDKPAVPREFPDNGLEKALGGKGTLLAKPEGSY